MKLDIEQARIRFAAARVTRLGTVTPTGAPHLVPVTTAVLDDTVVFAVDLKPKSTTALRRLANIAAEPRVCFLADEYHQDWQRLWWVRADAIAAVLTDGAGYVAALDALAAKYPQYEEVRPSGPLVVARVVRWSGWSARS